MKKYLRELCILLLSVITQKYKENNWPITCFIHFFFISLQQRSKTI